MKHVFIVHSHITWIVTQLIISFKNISFSDVILFEERGFIIADKRFRVMKVEDKIGPVPLSLLPNKTFKSHIIRNDSYIQDEYFLYIPMSWAMDVVTFIASSKCIGYHYYEEGLSYYVNKNLEKIDYGFLKNTYYKLRFNSYWNSFLLRYTSFNIFHEKYLGSYVLHKESFKEDEKRTLLEFDEGILKNKERFKEDKYDVIMVFDAISVFHIVNSTDVINILTDIIIPFVKERKYSNIGYKFHMEHYNDHNGIKERIILENILSKELPNSSSIESNFSIEQYVSINKDVHIITYVSALTLYASLLGASVYTVYEEVIKKSGKLILPDFVIDQVNKLPLIEIE